MISGISILIPQSDANADPKGAKGPEQKSERIGKKDADKGNRHFGLGR